MKPLDENAGELMNLPVTGKAGHDFIAVAMATRQPKHSMSECGDRCGVPTVFLGVGRLFSTAIWRFAAAGPWRKEGAYRPDWPVVVDGAAGGGVDWAVLCVRILMTPVRTSTTVRAHTPRIAVHIRIARVPRRSSLRVISPDIARSLCS